MKQILYTPKITGASTQYNKIDLADMTLIQNYCIRYLALMGELSINPNENIRQFIKQWWLKRTRTLPKGKSGLNTPESFVSGMLNNLMYGTQNDLSDIQMDAIQNISAVMAEFADAVTDLKLQNAATPFETIQFRQQLFYEG
jgi:hypothetical protein